MEMLCVVCAAIAGKRLDIREGQWRVAVCPDCQKSEQLLWPVIEQPKVADLQKMKLRSMALRSE